MLYFLNHRAYLIREIEIILSYFRKPYIWCFTTYFAEGLPYTVIRMVSPLFLRSMQASLESIGLTSLFGLPWAVKFLWAPSVDRFGTKRLWMLLMQILCGMIFISIAFCTLIPKAIIVIAALLFVCSFAAATNDIAIDGYYLSALDVMEQTKYLGYRVMAYRIAMMTGTGLVATIGTVVGWFEAFIAAGVLLLFLSVFHRLFLPAAERGLYPFTNAFIPFLKFRSMAGASIIAAIVISLYKTVNSSWYADVRKSFPLFSNIGFAGWVSLLLLTVLILLGCFYRRIVPLLNRNPDGFYSKAFLSFIDRKRIGLILACIIFLRTGEFLLSNMTSAFMVDVGIKVHYGWIQAVVGLPASILGAMLGGWFISRYTLKRVLLPFLIAQNGSNLVYTALAALLQKFVLINAGASDPVPIGFFNIGAIAAVQAFDQFAGGLGTAVLMTFLMRICKGEFAAAHYAIGSGIMSISGLFAGAASGFLAARLGYVRFFGISFLASLPGMFLAFPAMKTLPESQIKVSVE